MKTSAKAVQKKCALFAALLLAAYASHFAGHVAGPQAETITESHDAAPGHPASDSSPGSEEPARPCPVCLALSYVGVNVGQSNATVAVRPDTFRYGVVPSPSYEFRPVPLGQYNSAPARAPPTLV